MGVLAEEAVRIRADTSGFHSSVASGVMSSVAKIAAGAAAALGGIKLAKGLFVDPIKQAGDFEQTLNVLQATAKGGGATLKDVSDRAMALGADLKLPATSANDAATAMLEMGRGGFTMKQAMQSAHGVLLLSAAAQISNADAATYTADTLHAFGLQAKDSMTVVDDFAGAANASTASMAEVGQALQQSGAAFHMLHIPIGEAATAIAVMANNGIKGSDAGTSLKTMLMRLNPTTVQAKAAMKAMGVETFDSHGKFVGLRGVIEQMSPKLAAMTDKQKSQTLQTIFGNDAQRAAGYILGQTVNSWDKQRAAVTKAGQAQKLADAQSKGFNGAMAGLRSTIETLQLQIGLKMLPVLTTFVRFLASNLPAAAAFVGNAFSTIGKVIGQVAGVVRAHMDEIRSIVQTSMAALRAVFDSSVSIVQGLIATISDLVNWFNQNRDVAYALAAGIAASAAAFLLWRTALIVAGAAARAYAAIQIALNIVVMAFPAIAIIVGIGLVVAALVLLYQRSATARAIMDAAWAGIKAGAQAAMNFITQVVIPGAIAAWNRFGPTVVATLQAAASAIRAVVQAIATIVQVIVDQIRAHWEAVWKIFGPIVRMYLEVVRTYIQTVLNVIAGVVRLFAALLRGDWSAAWSALKGIVSDVLSGIVSIVGSVLRGLAGTALALAQVIGTRIAGGIKTAAEKLAGLAGELVGKITSAIAQVASWAWNQAKSIGASIASGIVAGVGDLAGALKSKVTGAIGGALGGIGGFIRKGSPSLLFADEIGVPIGEGIVAGAVAGVQPLSPKLQAELSKIATDAATATKANAPKIADAFKEWAKRAVDAFDANIAALKGRLDAQLTAATAAIDKWKAKLTPAEIHLNAQKAIEASRQLQGSLDDAWTALKALPQKQADAMANLLAQQRKTMLDLQATMQQSHDSALLAGNTFNKGMAAAASDPVATTLIAAQRNFDSTKSLFDQGLTDQATFIAAADALDAAKLAAAENNNATTLLDQYNTWQAALAQEAQSGASITAQQAADQEAQAALNANYNDQTIQATAAKDNALKAMLDANLESVAASERKARDKAAAALNADLVARYNRIDEHLDNVRKNTDAHLNELARHAADGGNNLINALSQGIRGAMPTLQGALNAIANTIKAYLKVSSPTEKGPMSDLDKWWTRLAPTLIASLDTAAVQRALTIATTPVPGGPGGRGRLLGGANVPGFGWMNTARIEELLERIAKHTGTTANKPPGGNEIHVGGSVGIDASVYRSLR